MTGDDRLRAATAVVVNWNTADLTVRCAEALVADGLSPRRLVLVDNGSADGSADVLRAHFPAAALVVIDENIGYARAANRGAAEQAAETYFFVNNDAFVEHAGSLGLLQQALGREGVGIAVPRLLNPDLTLQRSAVPLPTPLAALSLATGLSRVLPNRYRPLWSTWWDHGSSRVIRASRAAVLAIRGELWARLGGWAEEDWMFGEDIDLSWRARELGWVTWFERDATFVHLGNASGFESVQRVTLASVATRRVIERQLTTPRSSLTLVTLSLGHLARAGVFAILGRRAAAARARAAARAYWPGGRPPPEPAKLS